MRYPAAVRITPAASRVYQAFALLITIILIALSAYLIRAKGLFDLKTMAFLSLSLFVMVVLLRDALWMAARPTGQLSYAQGLWFWQQEGCVVSGTLRLHLDLQAYLLVSFVPTQGPRTIFLRTTQWFHLEARQFQASSRNAHWQAVRRAVLAQTERGHEELAA